MNEYLMINVGGGATYYNYSSAGRKQYVVLVEDQQSLVGILQR